MNDDFSVARFGEYWINVTARYNALGPCLFGVVHADHTDYSDIYSIIPIENGYYMLNNRNFGRATVFFSLKL